MLVVEYDGTRHAGRIGKRLVVGRWPTSDVVIDHAAVSRLHAWIGCEGETYFVADLSSRSGTLVNGKKVAEKQTLSDGDDITVGPARLKFRMVEDAADDQPLTIPSQRVLPKSAGIRFDCPCGAPMWAPRGHRGASARCLHCRQTIVIPGKTGETAKLYRTHSPGGAKIVKKVQPPRSRPAAPMATATQTCGICQSTLSPLEIMMTCPACGVGFHADCWNENDGCGSYGCKQVGVLKRKREGISESTATTDTGSRDEPIDLEFTGSSTMEKLLLAASVLGAAAGALAFGVPSLLLAVVAMIASGRGRRGPVIMAAIVISVLGLIGGIVASYFWWLQGARLGLHLGRFTI